MRQVDAHDRLDRPGRAVITTTRSDNVIASGTECVMKTIVLRCSFQILNNCFCSSRRVRASSAPNGSSMRMVDGSVAKARAMATRCFMPPESSWTCCREILQADACKIIERDHPALLARQALALEAELDIAGDSEPGK